MQYKPSMFNNLINTADENFLLYNALSGEFIKLDYKNFEFIQNIGQYQQEESPFFDYFIKKGFIVPIEKNEMFFILNRKHQLQFSNYDISRSYVIAVTTYCNYKCLYCFEDGLTYNKMTIDNAQQTGNFIIQEILNNPLLKNLRITWFGGEPLLNIDAIAIITDIIKPFCSKKGINYSAGIISNGLLLSPDIVDTLIKKDVNMIQITLDGEETETIYYKNAKYEDLNKIIANLEYVCGKVNVNIRLNCTKNNIQSVFSLSERLSKKHTIRKNANIYVAQIISSKREIETLTNAEFSKLKINFIRYIDKLGYNIQWENIIPKPRLISCGYLKTNNYAIDPKGYLYRCENYIGNEAMKIGDIYKGRYYNQADSLFIFFQPSDKCNQCSIFPICHGGCIQKQIDGTNFVDCKSKKEEIIEMLKEIYQNSIYKNQKNL